MFGFRKLDVYRCTVEVLPAVVRLRETGRSRNQAPTTPAALSINVNIAEGTGRRDDDQRRFYRVARGSALESAAVLDAIRVLGLATADEIAPAEELLVRVVSMLTKMPG